MACSAPGGADFFGRAPGDRVYVTHTSEAGKTTVEFGDGLNGARPPTGSENVRAVYRKGIGTAACRCEPAQPSC